MAALKHLLAATDLSAPARHALERAMSLARQHGAALHVVHIASLAPLERFRQIVADIPADFERRVIDAARDTLLEQAAVLQRQHGIAADMAVRTGPLLDELAEAADQHGADILVVGARGAGFMRHLLLGSTAERIIGRVSCPVLVVKQPAHGEYRHVLVPVDFSAASKKAIGVAREVAPNARIVLLHVYEVPFEGQLQFAGVDEARIRHYRDQALRNALDQLGALCDETGFAPSVSRYEALHGDVLQRILEQEQEQDYDLIVMGRQGAGMLAEFLLGSVSRNVLSQSQCDVLVAA